MSAATDDIFSDSILNRIHALYLHRRLHHYYPNVIEVDSFYSIALFSNELVLVTKVCWFLHEGRVVKRVYWIELIDELPLYIVSETPHSVSSFHRSSSILSHSFPFTYSTFPSTCSIPSFYNLIPFLLRF